MLRESLMDFIQAIFDRLIEGRVGLSDPRMLRAVAAKQLGLMLQHRQDR